MVTRRQLLATASGIGSVGFLGYLLSRNSDDSDRAVPNESTPRETVAQPTAEEEVEETEEDPDISQREDVVDIREFGAVGDGTTDDSEAILRAIRAAEPGETVFVPQTDDSYLLSFDGSGDEVALNLGPETGLDGITITGERPAEGAQTLRVEPGSYDASTFNWMLKLRGDQVIEGLTFRNLTFDGSRPPGDGPAGADGEESLLGVLLRRGSANGGHDITFQDCVVRNCSATAFRFEESGVVCERVTARGVGRHGFNPVAGDTTVDPGFLGTSIKAVDCGGTGIDHRRGTARLEDVYTENNRSGNKWKHHVERLEVRNHRSVHDRNRGWRSNHSYEEGDEVPETQHIVMDRVFVEEPQISGIRVSGDDTNIRCDFNDIEVRQTAVSESLGGIVFSRDVETPSRTSNRLIVVRTDNGPGVFVGDDAVLNVGTFQHYANEGGPFKAARGNLHYEEKANVDPGRNVFGTPGRDTVGAFTE
ncbi:glycoside hydrolase family 55 protein [Haloarcula salinisoli]|uniref:Glycoside hydrolase family 55 protein n=1 Tax=Haloarcula salinisoli TaxID=2487746 RepID=A0A8J8CBZ3_9EURY|nr:glycoside hydrolase family 55 protein [Halomicroarcula salinisoli]MBX0302890.1 glycoside hydrolase family 55 protein [Halomicroarcula salinisoli]